MRQLPKGEVLQFSLSKGTLERTQEEGMLKVETLHIPFTCCDNRPTSRCLRHGTNEQDKEIGFQKKTFLQQQFYPPCIITRQRIVPAFEGSFLLLGLLLFIGCDSSFGVAMWGANGATRRCH
jgi:hypothetical protein